MSKFLLISGICKGLGLDYLSSMSRMSVVDLEKLYACLVKMDVDLQDIKRLVESRVRGV